MDLEPLDQRIVADRLYGYAQDRRQIAADFFVKTLIDTRHVTHADPQPVGLIMSVIRQMKLISSTIFLIRTAFQQSESHQLSHALRNELMGESQSAGDFRQRRAIFKRQAV